MLRMKPIADAKRAALYFGKSDGGYYVDGAELKREWGGEAAGMLKLTGAPELEQFERLLDGLDPHSGKQLTASLVENRIPAWDFTASVPKGVTTALEGGDSRIRQALWEAGREAMADVELYATTRVRKGGKDADRVTGNLVWLAVEHAETRPTKEDGMPDWDRHLHFVVANVTFDPAEREWKAVKMRPVFDLKKYFDRRFDQRMAAKLVELGYEIDTKLKPGPDGGMRYFSWDIAPAPGHDKAWKAVIDKFSRRTQEVEEAEKDIVAKMKARDPNAPDALSAVARDGLGASTRRAKRSDMSLAEYRAYWYSRLTPAEGTAIVETIQRARKGMNAKAPNRAAEAMAYAIQHHFERSSVVAFTDLAVTAMERSMGAARPDEFRPEAERQGVIFSGGDASTREVLEQEQRIIGFARAGRGQFRPLAAGQEAGLEGLSAEQKAAVRHVWNSTDAVMLIHGGAGTGKTRAMAPALSHIGVPVALLAPSSDASRGQLRKEGFAQADTVASFLEQPAMAQSVRGGIIWVDEASLLPINDLDRLCVLAQSLDARIVLQGDTRQHRAVQRDGNMLQVLEDYAGLKPAKLTTIQRQKGDYAKAVAAIRDGEMAEGDAVLRRLGWVVEGEGHGALVAEYARAIEERKPSGEVKTVLVVDPTHQDGDALTEALRNVRRAKGLVGAEEKSFLQLTPLHWTEAERSDSGRYTGEEVVQFFRNSGKYRAGERVKAIELVPQLGTVKAKHFAVYAEGELKLSVGDVIRITTNGRDATGKHRVDNGRLDRIRGFTPSGDIVLSKGWVLGKRFAHLKHGLVQTSPATQSKTEDIVLVAMNRASLGAMSAAQAYVSLSRGRERGMVFSDLPREELLDAVARRDRRRAASELFGRGEKERAPVARAAGRMRGFMDKVRAVTRQLRQRAAKLVREPLLEKEIGHAT